MELFLFKTDEVASQIIEVKNLLYMIELATIGAEQNGSFDNIDSEGFLTLAQTARKKLANIESSMKTVLLGIEDDNNLVILEAESK